jgi:hypothetical protein
MWIDKENSFCLVTSAGLTAWAVTAQTDNVSPNVIDMTHIPRNIIHEGFYFVAECVAVPVSAGGGTMNIQLVTSAAVGLTAPQVVWSSGVIANATIVAYTANSILYAIKVPPVLLLRYLGVLLTIGTAVWTAGSFRMFLTPNAPYFIAATP